MSGVSMRTVANGILLDTGNNPSLHVNIVPGQGDTNSLIGLLKV